MEKQMKDKLFRFRHYDNSLENNLSMYDHMPYYRDENLCNQSTIALESGNVIKYYRVKLLDPFELKKN